MQEVLIRLCFGLGIEVVTCLCFMSGWAEERLNDIVGSAYYVAPEVLHRSYSLEADIWSIGVITYILLCGSRPFWARTESGIFRAVLRADPNFDDLPWPSVSPEAKDFVKRLLNKDYRKRMTAAQALSKSWVWLIAFENKENRCAFGAAIFLILLRHNVISFPVVIFKIMRKSCFLKVCKTVTKVDFFIAAHPWLRNENHPVPLDILIYKLVKSYLHASPFKRAALKVKFYHHA